MKIISRQDALKQGLTYYFTGKPCKRGHIAPKRTLNYTCLECERQSDKRRAGTTKRLASKRAEYKRNQDKYNAYDKARAKKPERLQTARDWKDANRAYHNAQSVAYTLNRVKTDRQFAMIMQMRRAVINAVKRGGISKAGKTFDLIGCTGDELCRHLERQFADGMNWDNYGYYGWHVDHIRPCASFDLTDPKQQKQCFHYTNLQPLWRADNRAKSDHWQTA
jgi:hypothetical protein